MKLDLAIGETSDLGKEDNSKITSLVERVRDLNARLHDIRREQLYQKVRTRPLLS